MFASMPESAIVTACKLERYLYVGIADSKTYKEQSFDTALEVDEHFVNPAAGTMACRNSDDMLEIGLDSGVLDKAQKLWRVHAGNCSMAAAQGCEPHLDGTFDCCSFAVPNTGFHTSGTRILICAGGLLLLCATQRLPKQL